MPDGSPDAERSHDAPASTPALTGDAQGWHELCRTEEVPREMGQFVSVGEKRVAVFRDGERFRVIDDACPHAGASLSAGFLENGCVVCPWHFWEIDLKSGQCTNAADARVNAYEVRVEADRILAKLGDTRPRPE